MEEKNLIKSEKVSLKKLFIVVYSILLIAIMGNLIFNIFPYMRYREGHDIANELYDEAPLVYGIKVLNKYNEYCDDYMGDLGFYGGYHNYLPDHNFFTYYLSKSVYFNIWIVITFLVILINLYYLLDKNTGIIIENNLVTYRKLNRKRKQFMLADIKSVETTFLKGLKISGNGIKQRLILIKNNEEIKNAIIEELSNVSDNDIIETDISSADKLQKYKNLLDNGTITQEEFDAKKKQLLNL